MHIIYYFKGYPIIDLSLHLRSAKSVKLNLPKYNYETIMGRSFC